MSEGKFSQPRPHRDEERQIEESFRQLTEDKKRRKKAAYNVEEDIQNTVREISAQEVSLPENNMRPFERSAKLDQTVQVNPEQLTSRQTTVVPPQKPAQQPPQTPRQNPVPRKPDYTTFSEEMDFRFDRDFQQPKPVFQEPPLFTEEAEPEEEPDFIDKLMNFGSFFRKHQTPVILGLCGAAMLLIVLFVSIFFTGSKQEEGPVLGGNVEIAGVNIEGMTKDQAIQAVKQTIDTAYAQNDMVVDFGTAQLNLTARDTGAQLDVAAAVEAAFALTPSLQTQYVALLPYLQLNTDYIYGTLKAYAEDTGSSLTQTSYGLEGNEPNLSADGFNENAPTQTLVIIMGTPGIGFDVEDVYEKVLDAYSLHSFLVEVKNVESVSEPDPIDLEAIYEEFYIAPVNASYNLQNFETKAGSYGYEFDLEAAKLLVSKAQHGEVLRIPMEYIAPEILDNDAFFKDILGEYQTRGTGNDDRNQNLRLACAAINGTSLNPGESLSFKSLMNKASGFRMAPEDTGREDVERGGISQVASTLYYAALTADLNISNRNTHDYLPSFIDYGLDATENLTIINSTGYPIRIDAEYSGGYVKVSIAGTEERNHYVMLDSSIANSTAANTVYEDFDFDNEEGYEDGDVIEEGSAGYLVKSYKVKYDRRTGKELSRDFLANSQYPAVDRVIARVAPPETEPPTEPATEPATEPSTESSTEAVTQPEETIDDSEVAPDETIPAEG